jgi:SAM-dependent methyltransferase
MHDPALQAQIDAAAEYDSVFVPALFGQWAPIVAEAAGIRAGQRVLDVGCGTGVLAREAEKRTGPSGQVTGVDPSAAMLAVAQRLAPAIDWREGVAEALPFPDGSFDAVVSQFGLMFFSDRHQALREMHRVLAPGGRLAVAVWDSLNNLPAYAAEVALLERTAGRAAADALRAPFALGNKEDLATLIHESGVTAPDITSRTGTGLFPSVRAMVEADLRGWLPVMGVHLADDEILGILDQAEQALGRYATADGRASFRLSILLVAATKA